MTAKPRHMLTSPPRGTGHPATRRLVAGFGAGILAVSVLGGTAASSAPGTPAGGAARGAAFVASASAPEVPWSIGRVGGSLTSTPQTLDQIFALLARAERVAHDSGREITPAISQAAGELGMLLTTYLAQQESAGAAAPLPQEAMPDAAVPAPVAPAPGAPASPNDPASPAPSPADPAPTGVESATSASHVVAETQTPSVPADPAQPVPADPAPPTPADPVQPDPADLPDAGEDAPAEAPVEPPADAPVVVAPATEPAPEPEPGLILDPATSADEQPEVTFDDVVLAAMRLATLLDSEGAYRVAVLAAPLSPGDTPLTTMLRDAVAQYGTSTAGYTNGRIPAEVLCPLPFAPGHRLRCDAAAQLVALNTAFQAKFGRPIPMTDSYRTYETQVALKIQKPHLAATPGNSMHGWGLAVDLSAPISAGTSAEYLWLRLNGPAYGWDNPSWARLDGAKPEPWHFEFFAGGPIPNRALSPADVALFRAAGVTPGTSTRTPTSTQPTQQPSPTPTQPVVDPSPSPTPTQPVVDPSPSPSPSESPSPSPSETPSPSPSETPSPTPSETPTPSESPSPSPTPTPSDSPTPTPSPTPSTTPTPTPTTTPAPTPTPDPSATPAPSSSPVPAVTPEPSATPLPTTSPDPDPEDGAETAPGADAGATQNPAADSAS